MHSVSIRYESPSLGGPARMSVLCPPGRGPFPVLYLLHGLGGDCETWWRVYDLEGLAARSRILIAMPEGGRSYYVNDRRAGGLGLWEDAIVRDARGVVERAFRVATNREARGIAGMSMGGYGALMLALRHPDLFGAAGCLSGSLYFGSRPHPHGEPFQTALAAGLPKGQYDVFELARRVAVDGPRPHLWISCGTEDGHLDTQREFRDLLEGLGWPADYTETPGAHDRAFWSARVPALLDFMRRTLAPGRDDAE
jgi:S-formylglutathione hydrolase FrmB